MAQDSIIKNANCVITAFKYKLKRIPISYALTLEKEDGEEFESSIRKQTGKFSEKNQRFELLLEEGYAPKDAAAFIKAVFKKLF